MYLNGYDQFRTVTTAVRTTFTLLRKFLSFDGRKMQLNLTEYVEDGRFLVFRCFFLDVAPDDVMCCESNNGFLTSNTQSEV